MQIYENLIIYFYIQRITKNKLNFSMFVPCLILYIELTSTSQIGIVQFIRQLPLRIVAVTFWGESRSNFIFSVTLQLHLPYSEFTTKMD